MADPQTDANVYLLCLMPGTIGEFVAMFNGTMAPRSGGGGNGAVKAMLRGF
jgi:hypothetical protein